MSVDLDLVGRVVLITGGVRGVGLGIARAFHAAGSTVVVCSRRVPQDLQSDLHPDVHHVVCDVRDPEAVESLVRGIVDKHGRLDALVNNAGGAPYALAAEASAGYHEKVVELNLLSPLLVSQAANAVMQQQEDGGAIVMVSSVSATRPSPGTAAYGAAKAGVDSLVRSLAVEWAPKVRVNSLDVGLVRTEQADLHYGGEDGVRAIEETIPLGRLADPREIGNAALFLASPLASYVSGATLAVHGGGEPPPFLQALRRPAR
jgi:NAD(P)-dependent dehydrogenase (short-subunit alcohol dehydrogenase family)